MGCDLILTGGGGDEWLGVSPFLAADLLAGFRWKEFYEFWKAMETSYDIPRFSLAKSLLWRFGLKPLLSRWKQKIIRPPKRFIFPDWIAPDPEIRKEMNERALLAVGQNWGRNQGSFYETAVRRSLDHTLPNIDVETNFELGRRVGIPILQPYWDADMVDLLYKLPPRLLNASGAAKGLVRCTLEKYLPSMTFGKIRKHSQFLFYNRIILNEGKQLWPREEKLSALSRLGIVDFPELSKTASRFFSGKLSSGYLIFCILNTEAWLQVHL